MLVFALPIDNGSDSTQPDPAQPDRAGARPDPQQEPTRRLGQPPAPADAGSDARGASDDLRADLAVAFGDRYELREQLGAGGFGAVYCGFDRRLNRSVAIKAARVDRAKADAAGQ